MCVFSSVTVFGSSAGGASVTYLMTSPLAEGINSFDTNEMAVLNFFGTSACFRSIS